jgi:hypothetical protein
MVPLDPKEDVSGIAATGSSLKIPGFYQGNPRFSRFCSKENVWDA